MKTLEKGQDKIKKISDQLRHEILEPAQVEAKKIIDEAHVKASVILAEAEKLAKKHSVEVKKSIEQERNVFESSLAQASRQSLEALRQIIENKLFNAQLSTMVATFSTDPKIISDLVNAIIKAVEKEGLAADLSVLIPQNVPAKDVNQFLVAGVLEKLKDQSVQVGDFAGGAQVKLKDKNLMIDISDEALKELISRYVRKDFRKLLFGC